MREREATRRLIHDDVAPQRCVMLRCAMRCLARARQRAGTPMASADARCASGADMLMRAASFARRHARERPPPR